MNTTFGPPWTVIKLLQWTTHYFEQHGSQSARLDAEVLLAEVLGLSRVQLYTQFDRPMQAEELSAFRALVKRRANGEPVAYLLGYRSFWTMDLKVDSRVLIPRPETERLVELALERLPAQSMAMAVDVGTGSGAIALALALERPLLKVIATDIDADALALARENAAAYELSSRIRFLEGDLLDALDAQCGEVDLIASNPPYIADAQRELLMKDVRAFEPSGALFSGSEGLDAIRRLIPQAYTKLKCGGYFLCEIGYDQGEAVSALLSEQGFVDVQIQPDYAQLDRVAIGQKP